MIKITLLQFWIITFLIFVGIDLLMGNPLISALINSAIWIGFSFILSFIFNKFFRLY